MRVLIFTSSGGTAHDAAAGALGDWLRQWDPGGEIGIEQVLENGSGPYRGGVALYNWIQKHAPWLHQAYWCLMEFEDLIKPGTLLFGRRYVANLLRQFKPDLIISTHPHTNRGHFAYAKRLLGPQLRCLTCCTELDGGFGFSRNWISSSADAIWVQTAEVAAELRRRHYPAERIALLGPLLYPAYHRPVPRGQRLEPGPGAPTVASETGGDPDARQTLPLLVLGAGANGANNHCRLLEVLRPFAGRLAVVALTGRRQAAFEQVQAWAVAHPELAVQALGFQGPEQMVALYRRAWAMVARPGARTATEALLLGCPLVFNTYGTTMPQEWLARRYFRSRGLERSIDRPDQLASLVAAWLDRPETYGDWRRLYQQHQLLSDPPSLGRLLLGR
jgi:UDP-N-acetylglucosamine:LPS N-acetylglucosamine transferase